MADWLFRLGATDWLNAATRELELAQADPRSRRKAVTHLRRSAGMALNAVLVAACEARVLHEDDASQVWGRSYIDHLRIMGQANASAAPVPPPEVIEAANGLLAIPVMAPEGLVRLERGPPSDVRAAIGQAELMLEWARAYTEASGPDLATL